MRLIKQLFLLNGSLKYIDFKGVAKPVVPSGVVEAYAGSVAPDGWLLCNGSAVSRSEYADLFAICGTIYGNGDGSTTFNLPDLRGEFVRGLDNGRGVDTGRTLGTSQAQALLQHNHPASSPAHNHSVSITSGPTAVPHTHPSPIPTTNNSPDPSTNHSHSVNLALSHGPDGIRRLTSTTAPLSVIEGAWVAPAPEPSASGNFAIRGGSSTTDPNALLIRQGSHSHSIVPTPVPHTHPISNTTTGAASPTGHAHAVNGNTGPSPSPVSVGNTGGAENRPRNVALNYIIKI